MPVYASTHFVNNENAYPFPPPTRRSSSRRGSCESAFDNDSDSVHQYAQLGHPRHLRRPAFRRVSASAIKAIAPELGNVAVEYVQQKVAEIGPGMYYTAYKASAKCPPGRLPREVPVILNDISGPAPTHVLAVYSTASKQRISLYPVHALVIAATCSNIPSLPYSKPDGPKYRGVSINLPVIPLALQNPEAFPILMEYLYTMDTDALLRAILPVTRMGAIPPPEVMARQLKHSHSPMSLQTYSSRIYGLYTIVTSLGVFDEKLWRTLEAAWEVLHIANA